MNPAVVLQVAVQVWPASVPARQANLPPVGFGGFPGHVAVQVPLNTHEPEAEQVAEMVPTKLVAHWP